jgi:hypothetical protein
MFARAAADGSARLPRRVRRAGNRWWILLALLAIGAPLGSPALAADRPPSKAEASAIKRVALKTCRAAAPDECEFRKARVSTRNARFAWADVVGEGFSGALLKRPTRHSRRFKVVGTQGGGIGECSYWRARAPRGVLRDLHISGLVDDSGTVRNCGKRR